MVCLIDISKQIWQWKLLKSHWNHPMRYPMIFADVAIYPMNVHMCYILYIHYNVCIMYSHRNPNIYLFVYLFTYIAYINTPSNPKRDRIVGNLEIMGKHHLHHPGNVPTYLFGGYYSIPFYHIYHPSIFRKSWLYSYTFQYIYRKIER